MEAIHRFKCSKQLNEEIIEFAKIHKFDTNDILQEQYDSWMKSEKMIKLIDEEKSYLQRYNYSVPIDVKIFKSIKYYYIKKFLLTQEKNKEKTRRIIMRLPVELKEKIQEHIHHHFEKDPYFKPSDTYEEFIESLSKEKDEDISESSIKKCYKNQYYQIKHKKYVSTLNAK
jgi:hypothetical protein